MIGAFRTPRRSCNRESAEALGALGVGARGGLSGRRGRMTIGGGSGRVDVFFSVPWCPVQNCPDRRLRAPHCSRFARGRTAKRAASCLRCVSCCPKVPASASTTRPHRRKCDGTHRHDARHPRAGGRPGRAQRCRSRPRCAWPAPAPRRRC